MKGGNIMLCNYKESWPVSAAREMKKLRILLNPLVTDIRHIGSTAVIGLKAEPVLDLVVAVHSMDGARSKLPILEQNGYIHKPGQDEPDRIFLYNKKKGGNLRACHIHIVMQNSIEWENGILFRDYLNYFPRKAREYELVKLDLAERFPNDRDAYTRGKSEWIATALKTARKLYDADRTDWIRETVCGAVVHIEIHGVRNYILIKNQSGHIGFPKGHLEGAETEQETALREIREETGLDVTLNGAFREEYSYSMKPPVQKTGVYFTAETKNAQIMAQESEIFGVWILPYEKALEMLNFPKDRVILMKADCFLNSVSLPQ